MPCPHHGHGQDDGAESTRRRFLKAAVAAGGASALSACLDLEAGATTPEQDLSQFPRGPEDLSGLPDRQHAWQDYFIHDRFGNTVFPKHNTLLLLDYVGESPPADEERQQVEGAFRTLERAFQRGTSGESNAIHHDGLLFTMGYAPSYFEGFDADLPPSVDLPTPRELLDELDEDESRADDVDAAIHLASGFASVVLAAEEHLLSGFDRLNGVESEGTLAGVFELAERRPGFIDKGQPAREYDHPDIPESAPLAMGLKGGFQDNLPDEDRVTIREGPFAGGTTQMVSRVESDLDRWYEESREDRIKQIYTPDHTPEMVGDVGEDLAGFSGKTPEHVEKLPDDAADGLVGHGQKLAQARTDPDEGFATIISRRDFNGTAEPSLHFDSWQREMADFVRVRKAMNGEAFADQVDPENNGIIDYIEVTNRATFLIPPREHRALPTPRPGK